MKIDPICGMQVGEKTAKEKGLFAQKENNSFYFCSLHCKKEFLGKSFQKPWYQTETFSHYFPYFLAFILIGGSIASYIGRFMTLYMGLFFIVFSFMKLLDLKDFVSAFAQYDIVAKRLKFYGYSYPFVELLLGIFFLFTIEVRIAAIVTVLVMGVGSVGVIIKLAKKEKFQCACLGTKLKVPLTKVTLLEDILMVIMAIMVLFGL